MSPRALTTHDRLPTHRRMADNLRRQIEKGAFHPGSQLPSTRELADSWATSIFTAHTALKTLVKEGWIERRKGSGTYIANRKVRFQVAGIYHDADISSEQQTSFSRNLHFALLNALEEMGKEVKVFIDTRETSQQRKVLPALRAAVSRRQIHCLIVPKTNAINAASLQRLPIPASFLGSGKGLNRVEFDIDQFFREGALRLAGQGSRSVGIISNVNESDSKFYRSFTREAEQAGLMTSPGWIQYGKNVRDLERHGYAAFHSLWASRPRPDAVVVYPDSVARGVVLGALEHSAGKKMKFVFHRNAQASFLCPFPATYGVSDENRTAHSLIDVVRRQIEEKELQSVQLQYQFETGADAL